jgi:hypothetical protein
VTIICDDDYMLVNIVGNKQMKIRFIEELSHWKRMEKGFCLYE